MMANPEANNNNNKDSPKKLQGQSPRVAAQDLSYTHLASPLVK